MLAAIRAMVAQLAEGRTRDALEAVLDGRKPPRADAGEVRKMVVSGNEAAMMLGVARRTVQVWAKMGRIRRVKCKGSGKGFGYERESVERLARSPGVTVEAVRFTDEDTAKRIVAEADAAAAP